MSPYPTPQLSKMSLALLVLFSTALFAAFIFGVFGKVQSIVEEVRATQPPPTQITYQEQQIEKERKAHLTSSNRLTPVYYGTASWYDYELPDAPDYSKLHDTCASRAYPKGTVLIVTTLTQPPKSVTCRVNDYIEHPDRKIDLSSHAFKQLTPLSQGLVEVSIQEK